MPAAVVEPPSPTVVASCTPIAAPSGRERARRILEADRAELQTFMDGNASRIAAVRSPYGTTSFPKLLNGNVEELLQLLRAKFETTVVPGKFFEMPDHFRIGMGVDHKMFAEGLRRLALALR